MEASLNRLIFARWREGNHPNQLHSVWLDLCKGVTARMNNLASLWKLSNGEVHVCLVAQFIEANTWKISSPLISSAFSSQAEPCRFRETSNDWIPYKLTFSYLSLPKSQLPAQPFLVGRCRVVLHLRFFIQVPASWRGEVQCLPSEEMYTASSCWTSLSGPDTYRHETLNPGSPEVLKILYKAICILLTETDCTWPALAAVHQRGAVHTEEGRRKGAEERFLIRLLSRRWCLAQQACCFQGCSWEFIFLLPL